MFLFLIMILFIFIVFNVKWTKQQIAECYGICRKTLGKWIKYCSPNINYNKWKEKRKINLLGLIVIFYDFGLPEKNKILTKGDIIEKLETYYHTVRENVALNLEKLKIDEKAYSSLDVFPPKLSSRIIQTLE